MANSSLPTDTSGTAVDDSSKQTIPNTLAGSTTGIPNEIFIANERLDAGKNGSGVSRNGNGKVPRALVDEEDIRTVDEILNRGVGNEQVPIHHTPSFVDLYASPKLHENENERNFGTSRLDDIAPNADGVRRLQTTSSSANISEMRGNSSLAVPVTIPRRRSDASTSPAHSLGESAPEVAVPLDPNAGTVPLIIPEQIDRGLPYAPEEQYHNSATRKLKGDVRPEDLNHSTSPSNAPSSVAPPEAWEAEYNEVLDDVEAAVDGKVPIESTNDPLPLERCRSTVNLNESDNFIGLTAGSNEPVPDYVESEPIEDTTQLDAEKGFYTKDGEGTAGLPFDVVDNPRIPGERTGSSKFRERVSHANSSSALSELFHAEEKKSGESLSSSNTKPVTPSKTVEEAEKPEKPVEVKKSAEKPAAAETTPKAAAAPEEPSSSKSSASPASTSSPEKKTPSRTSSSGSANTPVVPPRPRVANKFSSARAAFVKSLESRLQDGNPMRPFIPKRPQRTKSGASDDSSSEQKPEAAAPAPVAAPVTEVKKTRARGPARRPPTAVSKLSICDPTEVFDIAAVSLKSVETVKPDVEASADSTNEAEVADTEVEKVEADTKSEVVEAVSSTSPVNESSA
ncbi:DUF3210 family protein [Schizosaccharomyces japonicus yFS275]|uniref:DUF3210 family protein n=1 Tax=Schizosaccharomyces japonicus (strain yFS275 / FY16936) TaxID=402676 RepID=B6K644_SCHJY|nr:DUF3210 family protein [Schizosaccharomyces japonicus yFS275]EEB08998.1 DUF3210 family protein [Schizosaccharomyces japonicus yFS275]